MGYESRIYVVKKSSILENMENGGKKRYAEILASVNMCKAGNFHSVFKKETDCFIYADDGNTQITTDKYRVPLTEAAVEDVISWLENEIAGGEDYRRFKMLLAVLQPFANKEDWPEDIAVLHYGY